jgi:LCP family protein required for cell wall assembly
MASHLMKPKTSPLRKALKIFYIALVVISVIIVGAFIAYNVLVKAPDVEEQVTFTLTDSDDQTVISTSGDSNSSTSSGSTVVYTRQQGVYTCLLTGSDEGGQRADTIMLGCFDTNTNTASLISIPRDTLVLKKGKKSKINAVYSSGKGEAMAAAVSNMLGVPVDYYVSIDLEAFQAIVKTIGGVEFNVPIDMNYDDPVQNLHIHLSKGYQKLNAEQAMGVVRFRHNSDGSGYTRQDLDRVETQRNFLKAVIKQTITLSNVTKVTELIGILNQYVDTNMPLDTMVYFATSAIGMDLDTALTTGTLPGTWKSPYMITDADGALDLVNELLPVYTEPVIKSIMNIQQG